MKSDLGEVSLCRLEYWDPAKGEWTIGHHGVNLLHPDRYPERLWGNKEKIGRVTVFKEGTISEVDRVICPRDPAEQTTQFCPLCESSHPAPYDGSCLL